MKWIGQHIVDLLARFRSLVYFESGVDITGDVTVTGDTVTFTSENADDPAVIIKNTTNDDQASRLVFEKLRADDAVDDEQNLGEIWFNGQDNAQNSEEYAYIIGEINDSDSASESGSLTLGVASHNGTSQPGFILVGGSEAGEVDATIGRGINSVTTVAGNLDIDGANLTAASGLKIAAAEGLEIESGATAGKAALVIDNDDTDQVALDIEAANRTSAIMRIKAPDLTTANAIYINADSLTTGTGINLDVDDALTTTAAKSLIKIDYDKAGITASGQTSTTTGLDISIEDSVTNVGTVNQTGINVNLDVDNAGGTLTQKGLILDVAADGVGDSALAVGIEMEVIDGGTDIKMKSSADSNNFCTIKTTASGATAITTVDADATAGHLSFDIQGSIKTDTATGTTFWYKNGNVDDYTKLDIGTHGGAKFTTIDGSATAADFEIEANGDITLDADGDIVLEAGGNDLTLDADNFTFTSATSQKPRIDIIDTHNGADGARLIFEKRRGAAGVNADLLAAVQFKGYNNAGTPELINYSQILSNITDVADGQESGSLTFQVQSHGGGAETGLVIKGGSQDDEVDVDIGLGVDSVTTVAGSLRPVGQIQMFLSSFSANDLDTKHYIAFNDGDSENTAHGNVDLPIIAPVAGKLLRVCMRSNMNNSTRTYTVRLETQALTVGPGTGPSVVGTQSGDGATNSNMVTYDFTTGLDSGDNLIDAGDMVFVSLQTDTAPSNAKHYITCVFEWNFSTI